MYFLLVWFRSLFRLENLKAIIGSLKRRILRSTYLEMKMVLDNKIIQPLKLENNLEIRGYHESLREDCINLLNSIGSLGLWNRLSFEKRILDCVEEPEKDIFILLAGNSVVGFSVIHERSLNDNSAEIGYVAVKPQSRGNQLGYKLLVYILSEMKKRNLSYAYLKTDSFRTPAIKTYLKCGFCPFIRNKNQKKRWQNVMNKINISSKNKNT
ncbi:MAG: GNAT family N-acetyltransferase [Candidatus Omnitrophota bacterium]|nr:GNAT family N-acetyltransferase [Candidatus Omnitrophota bacterium]